MCGNYSREETIQGRKLYEEIRYVFLLSEVIDLEIDIDKKEGKKSQKRLSIWKSFAICLDMKHNQVSSAWFLKSKILDAKHEKIIKGKQDLFFYLHLKVSACCGVKLLDINRKKNIGCFLRFKMIIGVRK